MSPIAQSSSRALAAFSTRGGVAFLCSYMIFHALHVADRDPWFVTRLSRVPLFGTCEASLLVALVTALVGMATAPVRERELARLPNVLAFAVAAFTLEIVIFP